MMQCSTKAQKQNRMNEGFDDFDLISHPNELHLLWLGKKGANEITSLYQQRIRCTYATYVSKILGFVRNLEERVSIK